MLLRYLLFILLSINLTFAQYNEQKLESTFIQENFVDIDKESFYDLTNGLPKGYKKDGSVDYTECLQKLINKHNKVMLPDFPIYTSGLKLKSNSIVWFNKNSKLILIPNDLMRYEVLAIHNIENVKVYNSVIIGDKNFHKTNYGEWGFGIDIRKSRNIIIKNAIISDCWGDGIIVSSSSKGLKSISENFNTYDVFIENVIINNSRRNGITIGSGENIKLQNININNVFGTSPMSGIDIEPDNENYKLNHIYIKNLNVFNTYSGLQINLNKYLSKTKNNQLNINLEDINIEKSNTGILISGFKKKPELNNILGKIYIKKLRTNNVNRPFVKDFQYGKYPLIIIKNYEFFIKNKLYKNDSIKLGEYIKEFKGIKIN